MNDHVDAVATIGVDAFIFNDMGDVLLCHRRDRDLWNLPGGRLDPGEAPWDGAIREVLEEVGLVVRVERLLGVSWQPPAGHLVFDFLCRTFSDQMPTLSDEADEVGWFPPASLPTKLLIRQRERIKLASSGQLDSYLVVQEKMT